MLIHIIRHGERNHSKDELTEYGYEQSEYLSKRFVNSNIAAIYSSPMIRAIETARLTSETLNLPINILPWSAECGDEYRTDYYETVKGKERLVYVLQPPIDIYRSDTNLGSNWFETEYIRDSKAHAAINELNKNIDTFFLKYGYQRIDGRYLETKTCSDEIILFCHGGISRCILAYLLSISPSIMWSAFAEMEYTGVTTVIMKPCGDGKVVPVLQNYSDISHLYGLDDSKSIYKNRK